MLRAVLAIIDTTPGSEAAGAAALRLAERSGAHLGVASMLDLFWAMRDWHRPLVGLEIALEADRVADLYAAQSQAVQNLVDRAAGCGIAVERVDRPSDPVPAFAVFSHAYDMVVLGQDAAFHLDVRPHMRAAVERICRQLVRPVLVTPAEASAGEGVLIGYDGSAAASRAMHLAALLGPGLELPVRVVSIRPDRVEADTLAETGAALLRHHGAQVEPVGLQGDGAEGERFLRLLAERPPGLMVLGSIGHSGWREALMGSTTRTLLADARLPLLVGS